MKKFPFVLLLLALAAAGVWYLVRREPAASPPNAVETQSSLPEGWRGITFGGAVMERAGYEDGVFRVVAAGVGVRAEAPSFALVARDVGVPLDAQARVLPDAAMGAGGGAGWMIRESGNADAPFVSVFRDHEGIVRVEASASMDVPAISRALKNADGLDYLRIIVDGVVLKASCSRDGVNWPVAENITAPWLTNHPVVGLVLFSGDAAQMASAEFRDVLFNPATLR